MTEPQEISSSSPILPNDTAADDTTVPFQLIATSADIQGEGNFPQGCTFSPDGLCVLTSTAGDYRLRLYNTPTTSNESADATKLEWKTALSIHGGDSIRSYSWYPQMNSSNPASCCFASASRDQPIHLYDAYSGKIRATYRPFNAMDEMESPAVVEFSPDGQHIYAGGFKTDRTIHVFDTATPGRDSTILRLGKTKRSSDGQKGLVSAITFSPQTMHNSVFCVGTYSPGSIYVYDERLPSGTPASTVLQGVSVVGHGKSHSRKKRRFAATQDNDEDEVNIFSAAKTKWFHSRARGGVTQLKFHPCSEYILYSASRRSDAILAWDLRMVSGNTEHASCPIRGIGSFATNNDTNQRIEFDFDEHGKRLFVGGVDRCVRTYNVESGKLISELKGFGDVANGVSFASSRKSSSGLLAVATGARRFPEEANEDDSSTVMDSNTEITAPGSIELYSMTDQSESANTTDTATDKE